ncbi:MAG TPA: hypothetical protein PK771_03195, partial [Spirochaetota bacterium]|nr:hypothetical protein [Spirochaetota bacterium]
MNLVDNIIINLNKKDSSNDTLVKNEKRNEIRSKIKKLYLDFDKIETQLETDNVTSITESIKLLIFDVGNLLSISLKDVQISNVSDISEILNDVKISDLKLFYQNNIEKILYTD